MYKLMKGSAVAVALSTLLVGCGENTQTETTSGAASNTGSNGAASTVLTVETVALERSPSYKVQLNMSVC